MSPLHAHVRQPRRHLPCFHSLDAFDLATAIRTAPIGANAERTETPEIRFQPEITPTAIGTSPTTSIKAPATNSGVRNAFRVTGSIATRHLRPPNGLRVSGERGGEADERVRCTRMLGGPQEDDHYAHKDSEDEVHHRPRAIGRHR